MLAADGAIFIADDAATAKTQAVKKKKKRNTMARIRLLNYNILPEFR